MEVLVPETRADSSDVAVEATLCSAYVEGQRTLKQTTEDLHLICTGILGYLKPLDYELDEKTKQETLEHV